MSRTDNPAGTVQQLADIDKLVHEPARLMILATLYVLESADFLFLMRQTGLTQGNLSSHLTKLEEAGHVDIQKEFVGKRPHTMLKLTEQGREAMDQYRNQMQALLDGLQGTTGGSK